MRFIAIARDKYKDAILFDPITRFEGAGYSHFWQRIGKNWIHSNASPDALKLTLETVNNIPAVSVAGYRETRADLDRSVFRYLKREPQTQAPPK